MNQIERIKNLAEQARIKDHWSIDEARYLTNYLDEKKFAQLVVKECLDQLLIGDRDEDYDKGIYWSREQIKQHFGVKE